MHQQRALLTYTRWLHSYSRTLAWRIIRHAPANGKECHPVRHVISRPLTGDRCQLHAALHLRTWLCTPRSDVTSIVALKALPVGSRVAHAACRWLL